MAVPKQKRSRSRTHHKRAKIYKAFSVPVSVCPNCGAPKLPHRVCLNCGYYGKKQVFEVAQ